MHGLKLKRQLTLKQSMICLYCTVLYLHLILTSTSVCARVCVCAGKRDTGMVVKMDDMHYKSESLTFSADSLGYVHSYAQHLTLPCFTVLHLTALALLFLPAHCHTLPYPALFCMSFSE
jgi:hypothetical protein